MNEINEDSSEEILHVVTSIFNPTGSEIRYKLYLDFKQYLSQFENVILVTIELAFGDAPFIVTSTSYDGYHLQLRTDDIMWYKENLNNIAFKELYSIVGPSGKVAWIDADVAFENKNWVNDTLRLLNDYRFLQLFDTCNSLGPDNEILSSDHSFIYRWHTGIDTPEKRGRSGMAWASTLGTLHQLNWLPDWDIVGAGDWFTAFALTNQASLNRSPVKKKNNTWVNKVNQDVNESVTFVPGTISHFFHGYPSDRGYGTRDNILIENKFDPDKDIGYREDGLLYFKSDKSKLRQDLIKYFNSTKIHGPGETSGP